MSRRTELQRVSRRDLFSFLGLGVGIVSAVVLAPSVAEAQTGGMERRDERREDRQENRQDRQQDRQERRNN